MKKYWIPLIIIAITLLATFRLIRPGYFPMYDDMQVVRLYEMDQCFKDFQFPCRWVPDLGFGYGYPMYQYYAPLPYYIMELVHLLGVSFLDSIKIGFILAVFASTVFFYLLVRYFFNVPAAIAATFLYTLAPFRAADLYVRGAMGELWGMAALPLLFLGLEYLLRSRGKISIVIFALTVGLFLITHNLTVLMAMILFIPWTLIRISQFTDRKSQFLRVLSGGLLGLGLASFFMVPILLEGNLVHTETLTQGYFNYLAHFATLEQLLFSIHWGFGPSVLGPRDDAFLGVGPIHTIIGLLGFSLAIFYSRKKTKNILPANLLWIALILVFFTVLFLSHERSSFIWNLLPFLSYLQFPWRLVLIAVFCSSILGGLLLETYKKYGKWLVIILIFITTLIYGGYFSPKEWFNLTDTEKLTGEMWQRGITASIYDYLPKGASKAPDFEAPKTLIVDRGEVQIIKSERGSNWFRYQLRVDSGQALVTIPTYDFPGWTILVDQIPTTYTRSGELGLLTFPISNGDHQIEANLNRSLPRVLGDSLSLIAVVISALILIKDRKNYAI